MYISDIFAIIKTCRIIKTQLKWIKICIYSVAMLPLILITILFYFNTFFILNTINHD